MRVDEDRSLFPSLLLYIIQCTIYTVYTVLYIIYIIFINYVIC